MPLTVLSALARSELDPWDEAARLAGVPEKYAVARLGAVIEALPDRPIAASPKALAARLVALLPHRTMPGGAAPSGSSAPAAQIQPGVVRSRLAIVFAVFFAVVLGMQWMAVEGQASAQASKATVSAPTTLAAAAPPPGDGQ